MASLSSFPPKDAPGLHAGDLNVDLLLTLPRWPQPGGEVLLQDLRWTPGGSATNTAIVLARWGQPVRLLARIGKDLWGQALWERLHTLPHLDLHLLQKDPEHPTGTVVVLVDPQGERTFLTQRGANAFLTLPHVGDVFHPRPAYLHITGFNALAPRQRSTTEVLMEEAEKRGIPIVLDAGTYPAQQARTILGAWIQRATVLSLNLEEARLLLRAEDASPQALLESLAARVPVVALRMGQEGAYLSWNGAVYRYPSLPVQTVDTTGAGDAFTAGLLLGWRRGLSGEAAGWLAHLLGALATTVVGAGTALPGPEALQAHWPTLENHVPERIRPEICATFRGNSDRDRDDADIAQR